MCTRACSVASCSSCQRPRLPPDCHQRCAVRGSHLHLAGLELAGPEILLSSYIGCMRWVGRRLRWAAVLRAVQKCGLTLVAAAGARNERHSVKQRGQAKRCTATKGLGGAHRACHQSGAHKIAWGGSKRCITAANHSGGDGGVARRVQSACMRACVLHRIRRLRLACRPRRPPGIKKVRKRMESRRSGGAREVKVSAWLSCGA